MTSNGDTSGGGRRGLDRRTILKGAAATTIATGTLGFPAVLRASTEPIRIGVTTILSGRVAILGQSSLAGMQIPVDEINAEGGIDGRMIEIISRDSAAKPDEAARFTRELVNNIGCDILLNAEASGASFAVNEVARDIRKFCVHSVSETSSLTADPQNRIPWVFRSARQGIHDAVVGGLYAAEVAKANGLTRWATCSPDYAYGRDTTAEFMQYVKLFAPDTEIVEQTWPKLFQPDYTENITALLNSAPDAVYSALWGGDLVAFLDQASLYGLFDQFESFSVNLTDYPVLTAVDNLPEGVHGGGRYHKDIPDTEANEAWYQTFIEKSDVLPTNWAWQGDTAMRFIIEALKETGGNTDTEALAEATSGRTIESPFGVDGTLTMREEDNTLINYAAAWGRTISEEPYMVDLLSQSWDQITELERSWKEEKGFI